MTLTDRIERQRDRLPSHVLPMDERPERRAPQRWWERAKAGELPVQDHTYAVTKGAA